MRNDWNADGASVFLGCLIGAATVAVGYGVATDKALWLGPTTGLAEIAISAGTLVALVIAGIVGTRTYGASLKADRANRAAKSAELIAIDAKAGASGRVLGMHILRGVAQEDPATYLVPALHTLLQVIMDANAADKKRMGFYLTQRPEWDGRWVEAEKVVADALSNISSLIPKDGEWPESNDITSNGRLAISSAYIAGFIFHGERLERCEFSRLSLHSTTFSGLSFRDSVLRGTVGGGVVFDGCDLRGTTFELATPRGEPAPAFLPFLNFTNCQIDDRTIFNGQPMRQ
jgi:hypothetical protein